MTPHRILYLPIETKARELLGKLLLAAKAVERGWIVLLGRQAEIFRAAQAGPPGALVVNGIPAYKAARLKACRERGHRVVNLCEENIVYTDGVDYCNRKIGSAALEQTDLLCVAGAWNATHLRQHRPSSCAKIRLTGNPRFDTLMPEIRVVYEQSAKQIREDMGPFLLVNTNFGKANPFDRGKDRLAAMVRYGKVADDEHAARISRLIDYKALHMQRLKAVLADVVASGVFRRVLVRPHPAENHQTWRELAGLLGIEVCYDGNANAWMLAADAILHTGCTTGIEGLLLDRPVASFVIDPDGEFSNCCDAVSVQVSSAAELLVDVARWRKVPQGELRAHLVAQRSLLRTYIENVEQPLAVDRILDALDELDVPACRFPAVRSHWGAAWTAQELLTRGRVALRRVRHGKRLGTQKFPDFSLTDMTGPLAYWIAGGVVSRMPSFTRIGKWNWLFA